MDYIKLSGFGWAHGHINPALFYAGCAAHDGNDRIVYNQATGVLSYDPDGSGPAAHIPLATFQGHPDITASNIYII